MKFKRTVSVLLSLALCVTAFAVPSVASVIMPFETQYDYAAADYAWLTSLVIQEDLNEISAITGGCKLIANPDYPYTETPESFADEVNEFCKLYTLNENTVKAAYIYIVELLGSNSSAFAAQASDEQVRSYLENAGIVYPATVDTGTKVLAKALYTAMVTGAFTVPDMDTGAALEKTLTDFVVQISGFRIGDLAAWIPGGELNSLDDYTLAVSRMTLWSNGYDVTADTDPDEVYQLMAVMTVRSLGIGVDANAPFSELQSKYTAAMLGKRYGVTADPARLAGAVSSGSAPFYMLQLIGQKEGLSVRQDASSYEDAFAFVASETDLFDIEEGEFYADIYNYDIYLTAPRASLWVYPTSYYGGISPEKVSVFCNGVPVKDNYFTEVSVDPEKAVQTLTITVECEEGLGSVKDYVITVHNDNIGKEGQTPEGAGYPEFPSSESIISAILNAAGVDPQITAAAENLFGGLPQTLESSLAYLTPTFSGDRDGTGQDGNQMFDDATAYFGILDALGASVKDIDLDNVFALGLEARSAEGLMGFDSISFGS